MFIAYNRVCLHDCDMAGILYFPRQFRFVHDALEDLMESEGFSFAHIFLELDFLFVIVHAEADYLVPLKVGDKLEVHVSVEKVGNTSFTLLYTIYKVNHELVGTAKTVHVTLKTSTREKIPVPKGFREKFSKYLISNDPNT